MKEKNVLHRLRERWGLTQKEVAEELGVSRQSVSQWESGKTFPSVKKQIVLSRLYGVPIEQLYPEGAAQEMEEPGEEAVEEVPIPANDTPKKELPPKGRRNWRNKIAAGVIFAAYVGFAAGMLWWGRLTSSNALAMSYLIFGTVVFIAGWFVLFTCAIFKYIIRRNKK